MSHRFSNIMGCNVSAIQCNIMSHQVRLQFYADMSHVNIVNTIQIIATNCGVYLYHHSLPMWWRKGRGGKLLIKSNASKRWRWQCQNSTVKNSYQNKPQNASSVVHYSPGKLSFTKNYVLYTLWKEVGVKGPPETAQRSGWSLSWKPSFDLTDILTPADHW